MLARANRAVSPQVPSRLYPSPFLLTERRRVPGPTLVGGTVWWWLKVVGDNKNIW